MQQTKELNAFSIHGVCSEATIGDGVPQVLSSTGCDSPAEPQGSPPWLPQLGPGTGRAGETLEEIYSHFTRECDLLKREGVEEQGRKAVLSDGWGVWQELLFMILDQITLHARMLPRSEGLRLWKVQGVSPDPAGSLQWWLFSPSKQHFTVLLETWFPKRHCLIMVILYSFNKHSACGHLCHKMKYAHAKTTSSHYQIAIALWACWGERTKGFGGCAVLQRRWLSTLGFVCHVEESKASSALVCGRFLP